MRSQVTLLLLCMLLSVAFSLKCYTCHGESCRKTETCTQDGDRCMISTDAKNLTMKGCSTKSECDDVESKKVGSCCDKDLCNCSIKSLMSCCDKDLCNGSERFTLSFLLMLVPLLPSILFY